jgi:hypothetical protein
MRRQTMSQKIGPRSLKALRWRMAKSSWPATGWRATQRVPARGVVLCLANGAVVALLCIYI